MVAGDAAGVWLMQGWLFLETDFWQPDQIAAYLSPDAVPDDRMIVLDLAAESQPQWPRMRDAGSTKPVIWCTLHNYGGRRDLYGNLSFISTQPIVDLATLGPGAMVGTGITPEARRPRPRATPRARFGVTRSFRTSFRAGHRAEPCRIRAHERDDVATRREAHRHR